MSRKARFFEIISDIFDFQRNKTGRSIVLFIAAFATIQWLVTSLYGVIMLTEKTLFHYLFGFFSIINPQTALEDSFSDFITSVILFGFVYIVMHKNYMRNKQSLTVNQGSPKSHEGLILMLSPYKSFGNGIERFEEIALYIEDASLREKLLRSNWGPMVVAVEHHALALHHCWIICTAGTGGSKFQFEIANQVIKKLVGSKAECHQVELEDAYSIDTIVPRIAQIYKEARFSHNIDRNQIIADFTGGTAAMSGGLILATIDEEMDIEYLRQDKRLFENDKTLTREEIVSQDILLSIYTSRSLVEKPKDA